MTLTAEVDHIALDVKDVPAMLSFYTTTLAFAPYRVDEFRAGKAPFPSVRVSPGTILDFFKSERADGLTHANHICFSVAKDEYESLNQRLVAAGISVPEPKIRSGARGDGHSIYIQDPEENTLEFRWYD